MLSSSSKLSLNQLSRTFGEHAAVRDVNLDVQKGEFISLLGPSGCGKTTTLRMIAGFIKPTGGNIVLNGKTVSSGRDSLPPEKRNMSMIFQSYAVWPNMTVAENVAFGLKLRNVKRIEIERRVSDMLELVRLDKLAHRYPAELSGGQQQRVALARAIVIKPDVLLLDEPLSNLDANLREEMRVEIKRLHRMFEMTTIYVTHDQSEAMTTSDRIVVMNGGRIEQVDDPVSLYRTPKTRFVASFIGKTNFVDVGIVGKSLSFAGATFEIPSHNTTLGAGVTTLSVRPEDIEFEPIPQTDRGDGITVACEVTDRSYLGDSWDYIVRFNSTNTCLRVSTHPHMSIPIGARTFVFVPFSRMVPIFN